MSSESPTSLSSERPFLGLKSYGYPERDYFFGRKAQSFALYNLIQRNTFVAVVGSSGSGKSSLVRAGLRAILEEEKEIGGLKWAWLEMRPGDGPLAKLLEALAGLTHDDPDIATAQRERMAFDLRQSSFGIVRALERLDDFGTRPIVLVVDQFEELFRFSERGAGQRRAGGTARNEAAHFVQLLLEASRDVRCNVHVLLTMRSDFIGECASFHGLPEAVSAAQMLVPSLTRDQTEEVIRKPLEKVGATIDPMLVERLWNDSSEEPDQLPVLQHCLLRLWTEAKADAARRSVPTRHINIEHYKTVGGISNALSWHAEELYADLSAVELAVEQTFRALAELDREGRAIRRARLRSQLLAETGIKDEQLELVLRRFTADDCSFLTAMRAESSNQTRIDVGHEALLRRWKRLSGDPDAILGEIGENGANAQGWLKAEQRDGERYRGLVSLIENEGEADASFAKQADKRWAWWTSRPRTRTWAERYGGHFDEVERLLREGVVRKKRLVWRNYGIGAAAVIALIVCGGFGYNWYKKKIEAEQSAATAQHNFVLVLTSARSMLDAVLATLNMGRLTVQGAKDLLSTADQIAHEAAQERAGPDVTKLQIDLALRGSDIRVLTGEWADALKRAETASGEADRLAVQEPDNLEWQYLKFEGMQRAATAQVNLHNLDKRTAEQGLTELYKAEKIIQRVIAGAPRPDRRQRLIYVRNQIFDFLTIKGDREGALAEGQETLTIIDKLIEKEPQSLQWQRERANTKERLGSLYLAKNQFGPALENQNAALEIRMKLEEGSHDYSLVANVATSHDKIGDFWEAQKQHEKAIVEYEKSLQIRKELVDEDPGNATWQNYLAVSCRHAGDVNAVLGQLDKARENYRNLVATRRLMAVRDPSDMARQRAWEDGISVLAKFETAQQQYATAIEAYRTLVPVQIKLVKDNPKDAVRRQALFDTYVRIGDGLVSQKDGPAARKEYDTALDLAKDGIAVFANSAAWPLNLAAVQDKIGDAYQADANKDDAIKSYQQALALLEPLASDKAAAQLREQVQKKIKELVSAN